MMARASLLRLRFTTPRQSAYLSVRSWGSGSANMAGDQIAAAFMANRAALVRYLRARGAGDDAEDILQEIWLKLRELDEEPIVDHRAYLYRMAHNQMVDRIRAARRRQEREEAFDLKDGRIDDGDPTPAAEKTLLARERLRAVENLLASLGARTDHIFRRHRVEGISQREIAAELGISLSEVEKHLQKAYRAVSDARSAMLRDDGDPATREPADGRQ
jgi:RNA polymerase sigma factor (sigma-70 family)